MVQAKRRFSVSRAIFVREMAREIRKLSMGFFRCLSEEVFYPHQITLPSRKALQTESNASAQTFIMVPATTSLSKGICWWHFRKKGDHTESIRANILYFKQWSHYVCECVIHARWLNKYKKISLLLPSKRKQIFMCRRRGKKWTIVETTVECMVGLTRANRWFFRDWDDF